MSTVQTSVPDIAIVGGGPSGLSMAGICEKLGLSYVLYEKYPPEAVPHGGCLDLHPGSGQEALKQAGCYDEFKKLSRDGPHTIHQVWDHNGNTDFAWGAGADKPEIDRSDIRKILVDKIPPEKIHWNCGVVETTRDEHGAIVLQLSDGSTATGFKMVVGADGTWSKIRHLITQTKPRYSGIVGLHGLINPTNPFYPKMQEMAKKGPMAIMGRGVSVWVQIQGDGRYFVDMISRRPPNFGASEIHDVDAVKNLLLKDELFGGYCSEFREIIQALEGPCRAWPMQYFPANHLNWKPSPDVTLIGDAAHTTLPYVGEGANCAMRDAVILANNFKKMGVGLEAVAAYEADMQPYAAEIITRSNQSANLFFDYNAPLTFVEAMEEHPFIRHL